MSGVCLPYAMKSEHWCRFISTQETAMLDFLNACINFVNILGYPMEFVDQRCGEAGRDIAGCMTATFPEGKGQSTLCICTTGDGCNN